MKKRVSPYPPLVVEKFQIILLVMCSLQHDAAAVGATEENRHVITRAIGMIFPDDFLVVDGYVPRYAPTRRGKKYGDKVLLRHGFSRRTGTARLRALPHSWLVWKQDKKYLIDVYPLGGVPGASPPILIYQDEASVCYERGHLPNEVTEEALRERVEMFKLLFEERYEEMLSPLQVL